MQVPGYFVSSAATALVDGLIDGLKKLSAKFPLFIVSNCGNRQLQGFLGHANLKTFFKDWECLGNTGHGKTENIIDVVKRNQLKSPIYVGDSVADGIAADEAKVDYLHATYGNDGFADGRKNFDSFADITNYLLS